MEERVPVLGAPTILARPQERQDLALVLRQGVNDGGRRGGLCLQHQVHTVDLNFNASSPCCSNGLSRTQTRPFHGKTFCSPADPRPQPPPPPPPPTPPPTFTPPSST